MTLIAKVADVLLELPARSEIIYRVARRIVNRWQGENDCRMWRNGEVRLMRHVVPGARVVFDVGANVGEWAREALRLRPDVQLHCFEPSPVTFRLLSANNFPPNVRINNAGLGAEPGTLELFIYSDASEVNSFYNRRGTDAVAQRTEKVAIVTLDDYAATHGIDHIDFVKVDVEGHESAVINGARRLLDEGRIDMLQFEYGGCYIDARVLLKDIWDMVHSLRSRYRFYKLLPHRLQPVPEYRQTFENLQYANYLLVHESALAKVERL
ncbi:MAG TPA: FkbM family methyltransferase [Thermoanaerobaculia bacterium]